MHARSVDYFCIDVFATSKDDAMEIATTVDGGNFRQSPRNYDWGEWEIESAEEIAAGEPFEPIDERHFDTL